jgi:uncharacterized protein (TIGR02118 family)
MARLIALYRTPKDPAAFERYYFSTHVPLAQKIPGLRKYDVSNGNALGPEGPSNFHMVATLYFDSLDAIKTALNSPEGQAAAADLGKFADGGVELIFFVTKDI